MKKFKGFKKLMVFGLAVATIFSMAGITSFAANVVQFGGKDVDLDSDFQRITGAKDSFINDLTNSNSVIFTSESEDINLIINNGEIYGTPMENIKDVYSSNIKLEHGSTWTFNWGTQKAKSLEKYTFINQVPEAINVPVPFYFESGEKSGAWIFTEERPNALSDNTKINVQNLRTLMSENDFNYSYDSGTLHYSPGVEYRASNNASLVSNNNAAWKFNVPMSVKYTVDIKPLNAGGNPTLGKNNQVDVPSIKDINSDFFRNGNINSYENEYVAPANTTDKALFEYGESYQYDPAPINSNIVVMNTSISVADPLTGEGKATGVVANTVGGKTHIEVKYGREINFKKVDDNEPAKPVSGAEFTVYDRSGNSVATATSKENGDVSIILPMPNIGAGSVSYTMKETKTPDGYKNNDIEYPITINENGDVNGVDGETIVNPVDLPIIIKSSNPVSGEYVEKGQSINYTLTVTNASNKDRNIIVEDKLPDGIKYDSNKPYVILNEKNDVIHSGNNWIGEWSGQIKANSELKIVIPTVVMRNFDANDTNKNIFVNQASLQTESLTTPNEYGEKQETDKVVHYLTPKVSYTMKKERVTQPKKGLEGFIAGAGEVIDYKVTLKNTGDLKLDIDLKDVFKNNDYFTFVSDSENKVTLEVGETKAVTFKATVNSNTPEEIKTGYLNTVTSEGKAEYVDSKTYYESMDPEKPEIKIVTINKDTQKNLEKTSPAYTPVIVVGDPTIVKTSDIESQSFISKGDKITYTLTVTNPYNTARDILVTDILPKQVKASDDYLINGKSQGEAWKGSYEGKIEANGELVFEIPVTVIDSFNNKDHESNTILNTANLKAKDLLTEKYGNEIPTEEIIHYLEPAIGYTMTKERITDPDKGLDGFYAGTGQVIDYKVTLVNTGDITLDIDLEDVFINSEYFEFVDTNKASVTIEPGETREVIFKATIKAGTPANASYENIVTSIAQGWYLNARTGERVIVNEDNWPDAVTTARLEDDAVTPVIVPEVKPIDPAKPGVETGDNSSIALFGSLAVISGLALVLKRKKED